MGVRKNYRNLTDVERDRFVQALFHVKSTGLVDQFAEIHRRHFFHVIHLELALPAVAPGNAPPLRA